MFEILEVGMKFTFIEISKWSKNKLIWQTKCIVLKAWQTFSKYVRLFLRFLFPFRKNKEARNTTSKAKISQLEKIWFSWRHKILTERKNFRRKLVEQNIKKKSLFTNILKSWIFFWKSSKLKSLFKFNFWNIPSSIISTFFLPLFCSWKGGAAPDSDWESVYLETVCSVLVRGERKREKGAVQ